jgi:hypothetical protein
MPPKKRGDKPITGDSVKAVATATSPATPQLHSTLPHKPYFDTIKEFIDSVVADIGKNHIHHGLFIRAEVSVPIEKEVEEFIRSQNYDCRVYDSLNTRSKTTLEELTSSTSASARSSVFSMLCKERRPIVILLKDIDGLAVLEKGAMNTLGKILRSKRTLKQSKEPVSQFPVICVGTFNDDKKTRTLEAGCMTIIVENDDYKIKKTLRLKKKSDTAEEREDDTGIDDTTSSGLLASVADVVTDSNPAKDCVARLFEGDRIYQTGQHIHCIPSSIRTSVGLIIHENLPGIIKQIKCEETETETKEDIATLNKQYIHTYKQCLDTICVSDKIDRTGFQKQMTVFNELSSLLKSMRIQQIIKNKLGYTMSLPENMTHIDSIPQKVAKAEPKKRGRPKKSVSDTQPSTLTAAASAPVSASTYHLITPVSILPVKSIKINPHELEFTKSLTKYSTQYNNELFIERLNSTLMMDSKDSLDFMDVILEGLPSTLPNTMVINEVNELDALGINKLDILRIKKMLIL